MNDKKRNRHSVIGGNRRRIRRKHEKNVLMEDTNALVLSQRLKNENNTKMYTDGLCALVPSDLILCTAECEQP